MLEALIKIYVDVVYESVVYKSDFYQPGRIDSSIYYNIARYCGVGMKKQTESRLQAAQQLLFKCRQEEQKEQSPNYTQLVVFYQKNSFLGKKTPLEACPRTRIVAKNNVLINQIVFMARKSFKVPPQESLQLFWGDKLITNMNSPVKQLRSKQQGVIQLKAVTQQIF